MVLVAQFACDGHSGPPLMAGGNGGSGGAIIMGNLGTGGTGTGGISFAGSGGLTGTGGRFTGTGGNPAIFGQACSASYECGSDVACDPESATCVLPCTSCPSGKKCLLQAEGGPVACYTPCQLGITGTCPAGLACGFTFTGQQACVRPGTAAVGMPCDATPFSSGCAEDGLTCSYSVGQLKGICKVACNSADPNVKCPEGEQCERSSGTCEPGDGAHPGERCEAASRPCAGDGHNFQGVCDAGAVCHHLCDSGGSCPMGQVCDAVDGCRTSCDLFAPDPGCTGFEQCAPLTPGFEGGACSANPGESVGLGEPCPLRKLCGSDGKAWRGTCDFSVRDSICAANCRVDADCGAQEQCIDFVCLARRCDVFAADPGCASPAQCNRGVCTKIPGTDVRIGQECPMSSLDDSLTMSCGSDGKAWRGECGYHLGIITCATLCSDDVPCPGDGFCVQGSCY